MWNVFKRVALDMFTEIKRVEFFRYFLKLYCCKYSVLWNAPASSMLNEILP
ncbi:hypothetical protein SAMN03159304_00954 [Pseudomonas sp. NFACC24-1]|nr:hypothetical protein SAMN03159304_00954 [Pseudomonas sp. NFACC24-1]